MRSVAFLILLFNMTHYCGATTYFETFYEYFKNNVSSCENYKGNHYEEWVIKTDKSAINTSNKEAALIAIFDGIRSLECFPENRGITINDSKIVAFLVDVVFDTTLNRNHRCNAANILISWVAYKSLEPFKEKFLQSIDVYYKLNFDQTYELLALFNLTQNEKEKIFNKEMVNYSLPIRARLGDYAAITTLIATFEKGDAPYYVRERTVEKLIYSGNQKAIQYCIRNFNKPLIKTVGNGPSVCKEKSIRYTILEKLSYYFPDEPLLNQEFRKASNPFGADEEYLKTYFHRFIEWAQKTYGVKPIDPEPEPFLKGLCMKK